MEARSRGGLRTNAFVRLRKLFVDGSPLIEVQDASAARELLGAGN